MKPTVYDSRIEPALLKEIWASRDLLAYFLRRDLLLRYQHTFLGLGWLIFRYTLPVAGFTFLLTSRKDAAIYLPFVFSGVLPWLYFTHTTQDCLHSLASHQGIFSRFYFPRILILFSSLALNSIEALICLILFLLLSGFGSLPQIDFFYLVCGLILAPINVFFPVLFLCWLSLNFRDFRFLLPQMLQAGLFICPVAYSVTDLPDWLSFLVCCNPLYPFMGLIRQGFGAEMMNLYFFMPSFCALLLMMIFCIHKIDLDSFIAKGQG